MKCASSHVNIYRRPEYGRFSDGVVGLHERAEEVLAIANPCGVAVLRDANRSNARVCGGSIHLHVVLDTRPMT